MDEKKSNLVKKKIYIKSGRSKTALLSVGGVIPILKNNLFSINQKRIAPAYKKAEIVLYVINCIKLAGKVIDMVYTKFTFCIFVYF